MMGPTLSRVFTNLFFRSQKKNRIKSKKKKQEKNQETLD